jgi:hypothetical protein
MTHTLPRRVAAVALSSLLCGNIASASTFTGVFSGQGKACWGPLYIRTKTIQWITDFSVCYSPYTIEKKTFVDKPQNYDYILYRLNQPSKACSWRYIALYYYKYADSPYMHYDWSVAGFPNFEDFVEFNKQEIAILNGGLSAFNYALYCQLPNFDDPNPN